MNVASPAATSRWSDFGTTVLLVAILSAMYGARLTVQPVVGEESRWASGAREMLTTGDWIVPRQQGIVFPERPPMTMWLMALGGIVRGDVDAIAIRFPSAVAVVLTSLLIYIYARAQISQSAALIAAIVYASFGQVLQIGRQGESEAAFALFVGASLLVWHLGYSRGWRPLTVWTSGFALAGIAALVKGPQAPAYFGAITIVYLLWQRDFRYALLWQAFVGSLAFIAIVGAWQLPFYWATNWKAVVATWAGLVGDRVHLSGVLLHFVSYPLETLVCLLPWSPMLVALFRPGARQMLADKSAVVSFLLIGIVVAYPTVWLAADARGRYFMPLYPLVAVLIGLLIERCSLAAIGSSQRRGWQQFVSIWTAVIGIGAASFAVAAFLPADFVKSLYQPRAFSLVIAAGCAFAAIVLIFTLRQSFQSGAALAVTAIAFVSAIAVAGMMVNVNTARWNNPQAAVSEFKKHLPAGTTLVSLSPAEHRFVYYFGAPVVEIGWPKTLSELPPEVEYFCFMRRPGDNAASRASGRGRSPTVTSGTLPFAWTEVASICVERKKNNRQQASVVLGRVIRPLRYELTDATVPKINVALQSATASRQ